MTEKGGGINIHGNVTAGGDFVGRDMITITEAVAYDVAGLPNPYLGLRAFTFDDRDAFAGREAKATETVAALTDPGAPKVLLFITGASGCGKSSFAQAGLLPKLHAYYAQRHRAIRHAILRPSRDPMAGLHDAFAQLGAEGAERSPRPTELRTPAGQVNLLVIDQFEECFTQSDPAARDALSAWLAALPAFDAASTHVIATLRSDYLNELFEQPALWETAKRDGVELRAMSEAELRAAIQQPLQARQTGGAGYDSKRFEPALVDKLVQDAAASAAYLPLLQVTLEELWKKGKLVLANYGNLTDAIRQRAEQVFAFADFDRADPQIRRKPEAQAALISIFLDLVEVSADDDPRRDVRRRREKAQLTKSDPARAALVDELARARLLSISADTGVESADIIHESLIANWDRLREAVVASRRQLRQRGRFEQQLRWWQGNARAEGDLLSGVALAEARELDAAGDVALRAPEAQDYLKRSVALEQAEQQRELEAARKLAEAGKETLRQARIAVARQLSTQASSEASRNPARALLVGIEAYRTFPRPVMASGLLDTLQANSFARSAFRGHTDIAMSMAFRPDGHVLASGSPDGTIQLWDVNDLQCVTALGESFGTADFVWCVAFSPDGQILVSAGIDGTLGLWDTRDPKTVTLLSELPTEHKGGIRSITFRLKGRVLASGGWDETIRLWDLSDPRWPKELGKASHEQHGIDSLSFRPDGKVLASGGNNGRIQLWDVSNPSRVKRQGRSFEGYVGDEQRLTFHPDGKVLVSAGQNGTIQLWDVHNLNDIKELGEPLLGHDGPVIGVAFQPSGHVLVSASFDGTIRMWDLRNLKHPKALQGPLLGHEGKLGLCSMAISSDGTALASGGHDRRIRLWEVGDPIAEKGLGVPLRGLDRPVWGLGFNLTSQVLVSGGPDGIRIWNVASRESTKLRTTLLPGREDQVWGITFRPDGNVLASGSRDDGIQLWDFTNPHKVRALGELRPCHGFLSFHPTGRILASGGQDNTIRLWDVSNPAAAKVLGEFSHKHEGDLMAGVFSPDGKILATKGYEGKLQLWDVSNQLVIKTVSRALDDEAGEIAFSPDGTILASGREERGYQLWNVRDVNSIEPLGVWPLRSGKESVESITFDPNGQILVTGGKNGAIQLWDVSDPNMPRLLGEPLVGHTGSVVSLAFSTNGQLLASGDDDGMILLWDIDPESWIARACRVAGRNFTQAEWRFYLPDTPYRVTCPQWPAGE